MIKLPDVLLLETLHEATTKLDEFTQLCLQDLQDVFNKKRARLSSVRSWFDTLHMICSCGRQAKQEATPGILLSNHTYTSMGGDEKRFYSRVSIVSYFLYRHFEHLHGTKHLIP